MTKECLSVLWFTKISLLQLSPGLPPKRILMQTMIVRNHETHKAIMSHHSASGNSRHLRTKWSLEFWAIGFQPTPGEAKVMDIAFIHAPPGPPWTRVSVRVTEGISSSLRFLQSYSEIFDFSLSAVEAEKLCFHNHSGDSEANSLEAHWEQPWRLPAPQR